MYKLSEFVEPKNLKIFKDCPIYCIVNTNNSIYTNKIYKLKDFIDPNKLNFRFLLGNPLAIDFIQERIEKVMSSFHWSQLSKNPNAIPILEKHTEKIDWDNLSGNENGIWLLQKYLEGKIVKREKKVYNFDNCLDSEFDSENDSYRNESYRIQEEINWSKLSKNPNAIPILEKHKDKIDELSICLNPNAMHLIGEIISPNWSVYSSLYWSLLCCNTNPEAIAFVEKHGDPKYIDYWSLSKNPGAVDFLEKEPEKIKWPYLSMNPNPRICPFLETNPDKIDWRKLSREMSAIEILEKNIDKIDWEELSMNRGAVHILKANTDKIVWRSICYNHNPKAVDLLKNNMDKMDPYNWTILSMNPGIFELDYEALKKRIEPLKEELIRSSMRPDRIARLLELTDGQIDGFL